MNKAIAAIALLSATVALGQDYSIPKCMSKDGVWIEPYDMTKKLCVAEGYSWQAAKPQAAPNYTFDHVTLTPIVNTDPTMQLVTPNGETLFMIHGKHLIDGKVKDATFNFDQPGSGRIERLSDNEYARLQKLRQAVKDAETEIAKAHGVRLASGCDVGQIDGIGGICVGWYDPDHYEFRGQFLLVNVPNEQ